MSQRHALWRITADHEESGWFSQYVPGPECGFILGPADTLLLVASGKKATVMMGGLKMYEMSGPDGCRFTLETYERNIDDAYGDGARVYRKFSTDGNTQVTHISAAANAAMTDDVLALFWRFTES